MFARTFLIIVNVSTILKPKVMLQASLIAMLAYGMSACSSDSDASQTNTDAKDVEVSQAQDLIELLGWFEKGCGFDDEVIQSTDEYQPSPTEKRYNDFKDAFMTSDYTQDDDYIATVTPNYQLPADYLAVVKDITVTEDDIGVYYYVHFNNATYRGYELDKLELFYAPESDFVYDVLHFKQDDFMTLKPQFKIVHDDSSGLDRGGEFDAKTRTIKCYLGY